MGNNPTCTNNINESDQNDLMFDKLATMYFNCSTDQLKSKSEIDKIKIIIEQEKQQAITDKNNLVAQYKTTLKVLEGKVDHLLVHYKEEPIYHKIKDEFSNAISDVEYMSLENNCQTLEQKFMGETINSMTKTLVEKNSLIKNLETRNESLNNLILECQNDLKKSKKTIIEANDNINNLKDNLATKAKENSDLNQQLKNVKDENITLNFNYNKIINSELFGLIDTFNAFLDKFDGYKDSLMLKKSTIERDFSTSRQREIYIDRLSNLYSFILFGFDGVTTRNSSLSRYINLDKSETEFIEAVCYITLSFYNGMYKHLTI